VLAALAMGGLLWLASGLASASTHNLLKLVVLCGQIAGGAAVYALFLRLLGVTSVRAAVDAIRRPSPRDRRT